MRLLLAATLFAMTVGPATAGQRSDSVHDVEIAQALAGKVAGPPRDCVPARDLRSSRYIGERTILFRVNSRLTYRNDPPGGCLGLRKTSALVTRTPSTQICSGDIAEVRDIGTGFAGGSCAYGPFVPYRTAQAR